MTTDERVIDMERRGADLGMQVDACYAHELHLHRGPAVRSAVQPKSTAVLGTSCPPMPPCALPVHTRNACLN